MKYSNMGICNKYSLRFTQRQIGHNRELQPVLWFINPI